MCHVPDIFALSGMKAVSFLMTAQQLGWADKQIKSMPAKTPAIEVRPQASPHQTAQFPSFLSISPFCPCIHLFESCFSPDDCPTAGLG